MIPEDNRFESDPQDALPDRPGLPEGWLVEAPTEGDGDELTALLRAHEEYARGWASADCDDVLVEISERGLAMRENIVARDPQRRIRAWGSVHDRAGGRMLFIHIVARDLPEAVARACSTVLLEWAQTQARAVGSARGLTVQQIDTGAFADDERQQKWLAEAGFTLARTWWQMSRPVEPDEAGLVPDASCWEHKGVRFRRVRDEADVRAVHDVLEGAFTDHFNSQEETFEEFVHRLREDPGHRWDHWWLAELLDGHPHPGPDPDTESVEACGALVGTASESDDPDPNGSYVAYLGVLESARGRGVAKGLLRTVIADAATRGRNRVGLEVDADSPTGADGLYTSMGWATKYVTQSWHLDVPVT